MSATSVTIDAQDGTTIVLNTKHGPVKVQVLEGLAGDTCVCLAAVQGSLEGEAPGEYYVIPPAVAVPGALVRSTTTGLLASGNGYVPGTDNVYVIYRDRLTDDIIPADGLEVVERNEWYR